MKQPALPRRTLPAGLPDTHLDLGCGKYPRNPYDQKRLFGVDIRELPPTEGFESRAANLALDPIPYPDGMFGSVSAFDFIEHIPRVLAVPDERRTVLPFITLMNEIWRVLAPGGRLYAVTPAYPMAEAFQDPTHVNIITERTHEYFCGPRPFGAIYGFEGRFELLRSQWVRHHNLDFTGPEKEAEREALRQAEARRRQPARWIAYNLRESLRFVRGKRRWTLDQDRTAHLLWEFVAVKDTVR
jgi:SAM-dependent methyltransferase